MTLFFGPICLVLWQSIHMLCALVHYIILLWISITKACEKLLRKRSETPTDDFGYKIVSEHVNLLDKVPGHLAVILSEGVTPVKDLANIVVWCVAAGISWVTFYDPMGILKVADMDMQLCSALNKMGKVGILCLNKMIWEDKTLRSYIPIQHVNETQGCKVHSLHVNMFSLGNSKESIVDVTNSLGSMTDLDTADIKVKLVRNVLQKSLNLPEVDLAVCCGKTFCTYGFMPWFTRLTEFKQFPSHRNLQLKHFIWLLEAYSKCQQRFGK